MNPETGKRLALALLAPDYLIRQPPDWNGNVPLGSMFGGLSGVPRPLPWDAFASAEAPGLHGDQVHFAVDREGAIVPRDGSDPSLLDPLADALTEQLGPPFVAVAVRDRDDVWAAASNMAEIVTLPGSQGHLLETTRIAGTVTTRQDDANSDVRYPALEELLDGDETAIAHRFAGDVWVVELFPL